MQLQQPMSSQQSEFTIQSFYNKLDKEGRLAGAVCRKCDFRMLPPRPVCSNCLSSDLYLFDLPSSGRLIGFSEIHVSSDSFQAFVPYIVGIAEFENGVKVPGMIRGASLSELKVGGKIRVVFRRKSTEQVLSTNDELIPSGPAYWFVAS